jgi:N-acetylneuraminic acid mutarotase
MLTSNNQTQIRFRVGLILALTGLMGAAVFVLSPARRALAQADASWTFTGNLNAARRGQTATLLLNDKVLVAGGFFDVDAGQDQTPTTAELYDPATGTWGNTGNLNGGHVFHTATLLTNGKVLVAGGFPCGNAFDCSGTNGSSELYDPATGTWSKVGNLNTGHSGHTATLLQDGRVLIVGGGVGLFTFSGAELYDPANGTWSITDSLNTSRSAHKATLLQDGKVLITGGYSCSNFRCSVLNSGELYDPASGTWSFTGNLNTARFSHTATLLPDGKVLTAGGVFDWQTEEVSNTVELYDPTTGIWSNTGNLNERRGLHTATLLPNGKVVVAGGLGGDELKTAELYDLATGTWSKTADLNEARDSHSAIMLASGKVLVAAGGVVFTGSNTAELYDPGANPISNQIDKAPFFVQQHYLDFLNRQPDADGFAFWTNEVTSCGGEPACIEVKRINVSASFFLSIEFQQTGYLVYRFYKTSYGNLLGAPVPIKLSEFLPDTQKIGQGVIVNQAGWETVLENNKQAFTSEFVQRSRFVSAYPTSMSSEQFVDALFANAGVTPSASDRTAAINEFPFGATTNDVAARARVLRRVAENSTLAQQEFNRAFVLMQYFGYLRRNPNDAPEPGLNFDGYNFWLKKLNQFNGNYINAEMVKAFITSIEYRQRFGP